ncbi:hypothetical protein [Brevundimonas subvibrioides]|nr:hypothetical protein [Brevundimonas subvibrioides]
MKSLASDMSRGNRLDLFAWGALIALTAHLMIFGRLIELLPGGEAIRAVAIIIVLMCAILGIAGCFVRGYFFSALASTTILASIWLSLAVYSFRFGQPFVVTAGGLYFAAGLPALFLLVYKSGQLPAVIHKLYILTLIYGVIYIIAALAMQAGILRITQQTFIAIGADDLIGRKVRLTLATTYIVFGLMWALAELLRKPGLAPAAALALFATCLVLADSRLISAITVVTAIAFLLTRSSTLVARGALAAFGVIMVVSMLVAFNPDFDLLSPIARDTSERVRAQSFDIAQAKIGDFWLFGAGVPSGGAGYVAMTSSRTFYPSDIGLVGVVFVYGVGGVIFYCLTTIAGLIAMDRFDRTPFVGPVGQALTLTASAMAVWSVFAPSYVGATSGALGALFVGSFVGWISQRQTSQLHRVTREPGYSAAG